MNISGYYYIACMLQVQIIHMYTVLILQTIYTLLETVYCTKIQVATN